MRASIFGVSDGLVSNVALILGFAGASAAAPTVRLAGIAGLVAGAVSMAAGEYVSVRAQVELFQRELAVEAASLRHQPEAEVNELTGIYVARGIDPDVAEAMARNVMDSPELALQTHVREEIGVDPTSLGSPVLASLASFVAFAFGAAIPLLPWFFTHGSTAITISVVAGSVTAFGVGWALAGFTGRSRLFSALRQFAIAALAAGVTTIIGYWVG